MRFENIKLVFYIFPLFLVGIFFISTQVWAQSQVVSGTVSISVCGNGVREPTDEQCDGDDFGGFSCVNYGYDQGILDCNPDCSVDLSACSNNTEVPPPSGGGGGGGGAPTTLSTTVNFSGRAYPYNKVFLLKDAQLAGTTIAGSSANFSMTLTDLAAGEYVFSIYSEDVAGRRSSLFNFSVYISNGATTNVSGIFIAPTIATDKSEIKWGDSVAIFGQTIPEANVTISINSEQQYFRHTDADDDGIYLYNFDTSLLEMGSHHTKAKSSIGEETSSYGQAISFQVGDKNIAAGDQAEPGLKADINKDGRVNLIDFSIIAYWYQRPNPPDKVDINSDGKLDLVDFSIMAYYWTG